MNLTVAATCVSAQTAKYGCYKHILVDFILNQSQESTVKNGYQQRVNHVAIWDDKKKSSVSELITAAVDETKFFFWGITWIQVFCVWVRMGDWH